MPLILYEIFCFLIHKDDENVLFAKKATILKQLYENIYENKNHLKIYFLHYLYTFYDKRL